MNSETATTAVEVISEPAQLKAALKDYKTADGRLLERLLVSPQYVTSEQDEYARALRKHRDAAIPRLCAIRDNPKAPPERRVGAMGALRVAGIEPDPQQLAELASLDGKAEKLLLHRIPDFYPGPGKPVPPVISRWILERIDHPDSELSTQAVHLAKWKRVPAALERIEAALVANPNADCRLALALSELKPGATTTERLIRRLGSVSDWDVTIILRRLAELAMKSRGPDERLRLARICCDAIKHRPFEDGGIDDGSLGVITLVGELPPPSGVELLEDVAQAAESPVLRRFALEKLTELDSARAKKLRARLGEKSTSPAKTPGDNPKVLAERQRRARRAADTCVRYGLLTSAQAREAWDMFEGEGAAGGFTDDPVTTLLCFANRFLMFDAETGRSPNRHDELLGTFVQASAGKFRPTAILEDFRPDEPGGVLGHYTVQFIHNRRLYRFHPRDLEDWYDVPAVLAAANRALDDTRIPDRFINLAPDGQFVRVLFAPPETANRLVTELGYALCPDADEARRQGQAFEKRGLAGVRTKG